jgi:hypothetical protein
MALETDITSLRAMVGEPLATDVLEEDTLFTDLRLGQMIDGAGGSLERAAYEAWREKAGLLASLVNVTEGAASREMSELHSKALEMIKLYARSSTGPTEGRTRIGRIVRR